MFDPVTISAAVATASTAFNGIKRAFQAGRDLESMSQDLSRWMGAVSDVDAAHKSAKNPTMFRKVFSGGTIEQEAIEAFTAKKRLEEQRETLEEQHRQQIEAVNAEREQEKKNGLKKHQELRDERGVERVDWVSDVQMWIFQ